MPRCPGWSESCCSASTEGSLGGTPPPCSCHCVPAAPEPWGWRLPPHFEPPWLRFPGQPAHRCFLPACRRLRIAPASEPGGQTCYLQGADVIEKAANLSPESVSLPDFGVCAHQWESVLRWQLHNVLPPWSSGERTRTSIDVWCRRPPWPRGHCGSSSEWWCGIAPALLCPTPASATGAHTGIWINRIEKTMGKPLLNNHTQRSVDLGQWWAGIPALNRLAHP